MSAFASFASLIDSLHAQFPDAQYKVVPANGKTGKWRVEVTQVRRAERGQRLEDFLSKTGYQELTIKTKAGRIVHAQVVTKYQIPFGPDAPAIA